MIKITNKRNMYICEKQQLNKQYNVLDRPTIAPKISDKTQSGVIM